MLVTAARRQSATVRLIKSPVRERRATGPPATRLRTPADLLGYDPTGTNPPAVDGKSPRGSRHADTPATHLPAAMTGIEYRLRFVRDTAP